MKPNFNELLGQQYAPATLNSRFDNISYKFRWVAYILETFSVPSDLLF